MDDTRMLWVDCETTGLEDDDVILEVGIRITDLWGRTIAERKWLVGEKNEHWRLAIERGFRHEIVGPMHEKSGLWDDWHEALKTGPEAMAPHRVEADVVQFLETHEVGKFTLPMCGNSVSEDRKWMRRDLPLAEEWFHYRTIDVTTVKELCRRFNPVIFDQVPEKGENHRVMEDLDDSIKEYRFYVDNFLWVADAL